MHEKKVCWKNGDVRSFFCVMEKKDEIATNKPIEFIFLKSWVRVSNQNEHP